MSKKFYQIDEFFPAAGDQRFSLSAESPLDQVTYNIFSADDFADAAIYDYGERKCYFPETETPLSSFYSRFARWKAQRGADIAAAYGALRTKYKPLENYSMIEEHTGDDTTTKTPDDYKETTTHSVSNDYKLTDSQKPTNWKETKDFSVSQDYKETDSQKPNTWTVTRETQGPDADNASSTQNQIIPFNGSDFGNVSKSTTYTAHHEKEATTGIYDTEHTQTGKRTEELTRTGTFDTEHTQTGSASDEKAISGTMEDKTEYNSKLERSGNIGTTTSQMMAGSELDLRSRQFVRDVIAEFFDLVSVYV